MPFENSFLDVDVSEERMASAITGLLGGIKEEELDLLRLLESLRTFCVPSELFGCSNCEKQRYSMSP